MARARKVRKPSAQPRRSRFSRGLDVVLVVAVVAFASYTAWAVTLPRHAEWTIYAYLEIPRAIASQNNATEVRDRLVAAGYLTRDEVQGPELYLFTAPANNERFRAWLEGLGQTEEGLVYGEGRYLCGYVGGDPWEVQRDGLRAALQALVTDAALALDASAAHFGDNDFACWDEFWVRIYHVVFLAGLLGAITLWAGARIPSRIVGPPSSKS